MPYVTSATREHRDALSAPQSPPATYAAAHQASFRDLRAGRRRGCCAGGRGRRTETRLVQQAVGRGGAGQGGAGLRAQATPPGSCGPRGLGTAWKLASSALGAFAGGGGGGAQLASVSPQGLCRLPLQGPGAFPLAMRSPGRYQVGRTRRLEACTTWVPVRWTLAKTPGTALLARFLRRRGWVLLWDNETKARPRGRAGL